MKSADPGKTPSQRFSPSPRVTVIINCWNGEDYLAEALDSVLDQTFEDWDLVLFDDRSTDSSASILHAYSEPRFRYVLAEKQLDLTAAREAALEYARGEWVAFLDQDDIWLPDKLERQLQLLEGPDTEKVALVYGRAERFGSIDAGQDFDHHFAGKALPQGYVFNDLAMVANFIPMSSALVRRDALEHVTPLPGDVRLCPDYYFWMAISRSWQVLALQQTCCLYRVRGDDFSSHRGTQVFTEFLRVIEYFGEYIDNKSFRRRQRACHNLIGVSEIKDGFLFRGIMRIAKKGSLLHLARHAPPYVLRRLSFRLNRQTIRPRTTQR